MSGKKRLKKGIESLGKQLEMHKQKLKIAQERGDLGLTNYYEKEIENFERTKEKLMKHSTPKLKRKK